MRFCFIGMVELLQKQNIFDAAKANMLFMDYLLKGIKALNMLPENFTSKYRIEIINSVNYIKNNISQKISIASLAELQKMSINQFRKYFKIIVGQYPTKFINEQRLLLVKDYLLNTNYTLNQIASFIGFDNAYYFSSSFKKKYGISPKHFVNKYRQEAAK